MKIESHCALWLVMLVSSILTIADASQQQHCRRVHPRNINLLESLVQETDLLKNMNFIAGPNNKSPAVSLDGSRGICVNNTNYTFQQHLHKYSCSRKELVIRACVKFDGIADGPIFFLHSNKRTLLSLELDGTHGGSIKVSFIHDKESRAILFPYIFTDLTVWHNISVIFDGRLVSLYVNCNKIADQIIMRPDYCLPEGLMLNIGDNPHHTETFQGCLQDLIISFKTSAIEKHCPKAHTDCRYSAVHQEMNSTVVALMEDHARLTKEVEILRENVSLYEKQVRGFACYANGKQYDFHTFFYQDEDTICFCNDGGVASCDKLLNYTTSEPIPSTTPKSQPIKEPCSVNGKMIPADHVIDVIHENFSCTSYFCESSLLGGDSFITIAKPTMHNCTLAPRDCSNSSMWTERQRSASRCCGFCKVCEMQTECGKNFKCVEDGANFTCDECKDGYILEDGECVDIDECKHGRHREVGHYCPTDAQCVNTDGGFRCECNKENYTFINRTGHTSVCQDINECLIKDICPKGFTCTNTDNSFTCTCPRGFERDGDKCVPHCNPRCRPEGECVRSCTGDKCENACSCPRGLNGTQCENDINECDGNSHGCDGNATCVNFHGGYFCRCNDSFRGNGRSCTDIDECAEQTAVCPLGSKCKNTEGSYQCTCSGGDCRGGCSFQRKPHPIGALRYRGQKNCTQCICTGESWSCSDVLCNCSEHPTGPCCSHCNKESCTVGNLEFDHNQDFIDPMDSCKNCRCKQGNVTCTDKGFSFKCPPELVVTMNGCKQCKVKECTEENDGMEHEANNSCSVCTCKNKEWTCEPKEVTCPEVSCEGDTITVGCCSMCAGTSIDRPHHINMPTIQSVDENQQCN